MLVLFEFLKSSGLSLLDIYIFKVPQELVLLWLLDPVALGVLEVLLQVFFLSELFLLILFYVPDSLLSLDTLNLHLVPFFLHPLQGVAL